MKETKVLIVDDSAFMRMVLKDIIDKEPGLKVVGMARDGLEAVEKATSLSPDLITLDVEMPKLNGLEALKIIMKKDPTRVIMVSSLTSEGASITIEALENGAVDFIQKPAGSTSWTFRQVQDDLIQKIKDVSQISLSNIVSKPHKVIKKERKSFISSGDRVLLIASSTGGPRSLDTVIPFLPENIDVPVIVVQHMPPGFTKSLADRLNKISKLSVKEAEEGDVIQKNNVYIAPGNFHLGLKKNGSSVTLFLENSDKINNVRPAADFTFDSAAEIYKEKCLAVVLTGMGRDGAKGSFKIKHYGGKVIAESKETCVVYGMPKAVVEDGYADFILPNVKIADKIVDLLESK
jgi:two-component system chemotaxis response regulator CheB